jgi:hypothetical protein
MHRSPLEIVDAKRTGHHKWILVEVKKFACNEECVVDVCVCVWNVRARESAYRIRFCRGLDVQHLTVQDEAVLVDGHCELLN